MKRVDKEIEVFEKPQQTEVGRQAEIEILLARRQRAIVIDKRADTPGAKVIDRCRKQQGKKEAPIPARVKETTGKNQEYILLAMWQEVVDGKYDWQEKEELKGIEKHDVESRMLVPARLLAVD